MEFTAEPEKYYLILNESEFQEFKHLALTCNDFLLKSKLAMFQQESGHHFLNVSKTEFCMILIEIKNLRSKSPLVPRMIELGQNQDSGFRGLYERIELNIKRYSMYTH